MKNFEFNFWNDILWPIVTEFVWIPIIWFVYRKSTIYSKRKILNQLDKFHVDIQQVHRTENKLFDADATKYVDENFVSFTKFMAIIGQENVDIPGNQKGWNSNKPLNKFRQFFFYLNGVNDIEKYKVKN